MSAKELYPDEYNFMEAVKPLETWVLITKFNGPWYHKCGNYFQIDLDGLAIDGCGRPFICTLALNVDGHEHEKAAQYRKVYAAGSLHYIQAPYYNVLDREIRFYRFESHPVPLEYDEARIRDWIESTAKCDGLIRE